MDQGLGCPLICCAPAWSVVRRLLWKPPAPLRPIPRPSPPARHVHSNGLPSVLPARQATESYVGTRRRGASQLPVFIWASIAEFLQNGAVSQLCRELRGVLQWQHVDCRVANHNLEVKMETLCGIGAVRSVTIHGHELRLGDHEAQSLATLRSAPQLTSLALYLRFTDADDKAGPWLALLKEAPSLRHLLIDLGRNALGDPGVIALADLHALPALVSLDLSLRCNVVAAGGAAALSFFRSSNSLTSLTLDLDHNTIGDRGVQALATLRGAPALRSFTLRLGHNGFGDVGAMALATLSQSTALTSLCLALRGNHIDNPGALALATLRDSKILRSLILDVRDNPLGRRGTAALRALQRRSRPRCTVTFGDDDDSDGPSSLAATWLSCLRGGYHGMTSGD